MSKEESLTLENSSDDGWDAYERLQFLGVLENLVASIRSELFITKKFELITALQGLAQEGLKRGWKTDYFLNLANEEEKEMIKDHLEAYIKGMIRVLKTYHSGQKDLLSRLKQEIDENPNTEGLKERIGIFGASIQFSIEYANKHLNEIQRRIELSKEMIDVSIFEEEIGKLSDLLKSIREIQAEYQKIVSID